MATETLIVDCPNCGASVSWTTQQHWRPFCSERCRMIDLGAWADESHRIPAVNQADASSEFIDEALLPPDHPTRN